MSSALVALGFVAQTGNRFDALAAAVLPALFILGEFTFVRLLQLSLENMLAMVAAINSILGAAGATLLLTGAELANGTAATIVGVVAALICFAGHVLFHTRQFNAVIPTAADGASSPER